MALLFLLLAVGALVFLTSGTQFELGPYRARVTSPPATLLEKAQSKVRLWMRARNLVPAGPVLVEGKMLTLENSDALRSLVLPANAIARETEEVKAWIVDRVWSDEMCRRLLERPGNRIEATPNAITRSYHRVRFFHGGNADPWHSLTNYGLRFAALPVIRGGNIALTLDALSGEVVMMEPLPLAAPAAPPAMIRTNIAFSARLLLPPDKVLLVVDKPQGTETATHVFLVSARVLPGH